MGHHLFNVGNQGWVMLNKTFIVLISLSIFCHATTNITVLNNQSINSSTISKTKDESTKIITLKSLNQQTNIPTKTITINQNTALYLPPSANVISIAPLHQNANFFADEVKSHYDGSFLIYGATFLLVGASLFSR